MERACRCHITKTGQSAGYALMTLRTGAHFDLFQRFLLSMYPWKSFFQIKFLVTIVCIHGCNVRYGAFLRSIPLSRRVGDYAHCAARVVNATLKRLTNQSFIWYGNGSMSWFINARLQVTQCVPWVRELVLKCAGLRRTSCTTSTFSRRLSRSVRGLHRRDPLTWLVGKCFSSPKLCMLPW